MNTQEIALLIQEAEDRTGNTGHSITVGITNMGGITTTEWKGGTEIVRCGSISGIEELKAFLDEYPTKPSAEKLLAERKRIDAELDAMGVNDLLCNGK